MSPPRQQLTMPSHPFPQVAKSARRLDASELQDFMKTLLKELSQLLSSKVRTAGRSRRPLPP